MSRRATAARRQQEIFHAAVTLFYEHGYASTSMGDVAEAAGVLRGSLYHYLDSKEDLLFRIVEQVHADGAAIIAEVAGRDDLTPLGKLERYVQQRVLYTVNNVERFAVYWQDRRRLGPERLDQVGRWRDDMEHFLVALIEEATAAGELPSGIDADLATHFTRGALAAVYAWYTPGGPPSPELLAEFASRFLIEGIRGSVAVDEGAARTTPSSA